MNIRLNKKYLKEQKIQRKFADDKDWVGHDNQIEILDSINDRKLEVSGILEMKEDELKKNNSKTYEYGGIQKNYKEISQNNTYMKKGGITGDLHSLTNQLLAQKI